MIRHEYRVVRRFTGQSGIYGEETVTLGAVSREYAEEKLKELVKPAAEAHLEWRVVSDNWAKVEDSV